MWEGEERRERKTWCVICADAFIVIKSDAGEESDGNSAQCVFSSTGQFTHCLWAQTTVREGSVKTGVTYVTVRLTSHHQQWIKGSIQYQKEINIKLKVFVLLSWRESELWSITAIVGLKKVSKMQGDTLPKCFIRHQSCFRADAELPWHKNLFFSKIPLSLLFIIYFSYIKLF